MDPETFSICYPYFCQQLYEYEGFTTIDKWVTCLIDQPITFEFDSERFFLTPKMGFRFSQKPNKLPSQFYNLLIDTIQGNTMEYIIINNHDKIIFKNSTNRNEIQRDQAKYKLLLIQYVTDNFFDRDVVLDHLVHKFDQLPANTKQVYELKVLISHLSGLRFGLDHRFLYNRPQ